MSEKPPKIDPLDDYLDPYAAVMRERHERAVARGYLAGRPNKVEEVIRDHIDGFFLVWSPEHTTMGIMAMGLIKHLKHRLFKISKSTAMLVIHELEKAGRVRIVREASANKRGKKTQVYVIHDGPEPVLEKNDAAAKPAGGAS